MGVFESSIVNKVNEELALVVSKLKDTSFLREKDGVASLSVSQTTGIDKKVCSVGVRFKEKGSSELRKALERLGWKKERRESSSFYLHRYGYGDDKREFYLVYMKRIAYYKYAIYRSEKSPGLYSLDYIDSMYDERLRDIPGGSLIREDRLPIVVNHAGGRHTFDERYEENFVKIVEIPEGEEPLTRQERYPKNSDEFFYGWIAPNGDTYACSFEGHIESADAIAKELGLSTVNGSHSLEKAGFIKISRPAPYSPENFGKRAAYLPMESRGEIPPAQLDSLMREGVYDEDMELRELLRFNLEREL